ncbi:Aquaporin-11 [Dissostichus eleginoides]|uniref:Aquaporin-11 n=1 Tax=Dissostichus eleginoides TaxID=100907 RepID=A0AAD9CF42_DISEL|nr:Aquaporin-11 [Dissostichus eleginoides]
MSADVAVSLLMLAGIVALGEASRRFLRRALADTGLSEYAVDEKYRARGGCGHHNSSLCRMTGAVFNPALAFSTQFPCSGVLAEPPAG